MSFHEGPKCLDEGSSFAKRAEVVGAEVVGAEVSKIRVIVGILDTSAGAEVVVAEVPNPQK